MRRGEERHNKERMFLGYSEDADVLRAQIVVLNDEIAQLMASPDDAAVVWRSTALLREIDDLIAHISGMQKRAREARREESARDLAEHIPADVEDVRRIWEKYHDEKGGRDA
jgi:hypothetical protein